MTLPDAGNEIADGAAPAGSGTRADSIPNGVGPTVDPTVSPSTAQHLDDPPVLEVPLDFDFSDPRPRPRPVRSLGHNIYVIWRRVRKKAKAVNNEIEPLKELILGVGGVVVLLAPICFAGWKFVQGARGDSQRASATTVGSSTEIAAASIPAGSKFGILKSVSQCAPIGFNSYRVAISPDGRIAAVVEQPEGSRLVVLTPDCQSEEMTANLRGQVKDLVFRPNGGAVYVATLEQDTGRTVGFVSAYRIGVSTAPERRSVALPAGANALAFSSDGSKLFVSSDGVGAWNPDLLAPLDRPTVGGITDPHVARLAWMDLPGGTSRLLAAGTLGTLFSVDPDRLVVAAKAVCGGSIQDMSVFGTTAVVVGPKCSRAYGVSESGLDTVLDLSPKFAPGFVPRRVVSRVAPASTVFVLGDQTPAGAAFIYAYKVTEDAAAVLDLPVQVSTSLGITNSGEILVADGGSSLVLASLA